MKKKFRLLMNMIRYRTIHISEYDKIISKFSLGMITAIKSNIIDEIIREYDLKLKNQNDEN